MKPDNAFMLELTANMPCKQINIHGCDVMYYASSDGKIISLRSGKALIPCISNSGYEFVKIRRFGVVKNHYIHRLICEAFNGIAPSNKHDVAHNDGDKRNNTPENLRWATRSENFSDKKIHNTETIGERHGMHKLTETEVLEIREKAKRGVQQKELAKIYGVWPMTISRAVRKISWKHI